MRDRRAAIAGLVAALLTPFVASADPVARGNTLPSPPPDWTVTVGAEGRYEPVFQGSKREGFQVGPVGVLKGPRIQKLDPPALQGLGNIPWTLELGVFAEYWAVPWFRSRVEVRQGIGGHHGIVSDLLFDAVVPVGQWTFSGGPRVTLATTPATSRYFSIDPIQSAASGLPLFDAKGGVRSVGAGTQARYFWTPQFATHAFLEYERLTGDAASSPLVEQRGSPNQLTFGIGATTSFDIRSPW